MKTDDHIIVFAICVILLGTLVACQPAASPHNGTPKEPDISIDGGWSKAQVDDGVKRAAEFAVLQIDNDTLDSILSAQQQVVAGTNYRIIMQMTSGQKWEAQIYEDLNEDLHVTHLNPINE